MFSYCEQGFSGERAERSFLQCLNEAIAWCQLWVETREAIHPLRRLEAHSRWGPLSPPSSHVLALTSARARELRRHGRPNGDPTAAPLEGGRLLAYFPEEELFDGCAEAYSDGFFDVHNAPPCDTWVALCAGASDRPHSNFLISWVPPAFVAAAVRGIEVNPEECIKWLDVVDHPIVRALRRRAVI